MQMISTHTHNHQIFLAKRSSFKCQSSPLNPASSKPTSNITRSTLKPATDHHHDFTRKHLANLEKLILQTKQPEPPQPADQPVHIKNPSNVHGLAMLEGLNLARTWPEMKAAEEMSPRHLNRLKRLLSKTAEYSPRNNLGSRWREYHGSNDWAGLLDPLDENLRREVVRYGEFVQAAYHAFHSNPTFSEEEAAFPRRHVALPDRCYKVTKSLYSTTSVGLPCWVDEVAPDLGWMTQRSSWIGYVAVCDDRREIQRMGRRDIVISLRGTSTCLEWAENFRAQLVPMSNNKPVNPEDPIAEGPIPKVESGFMSLFKTRGAHVPSLAESVVEEVQRLIKLYKGEPLSITVTGHSLGSALAILVADELVSSCDAAEPPPVAVFTFGGPRVGNRAFADRVNSKNIKVLRIVNNQDVITKVPATFVDERLEQKQRETERGSRLGGILNSLSYSHVGTELRLETKMSPYLKPNADVACCHDLEAYLHLVDGFLSSNCPFRTNAKRSLVKLVSEQRSNVKQLYTSKAKALTLNLESRGGLLSPMSCLPSPS
ncbi:Alpha/beta-Hydrolases superfamily protein [Tripterygium wilfordii]|uniref:Alpha/beta-Hydrolases superfamily protein n=1 Tax=Tripterygium wilfordii TaxID=458696 RepID=A0A7J7CJJ7_TRIWF|nr:phospholipase A1-Ibeta2, chloroplastic [Tripterygium wilfordii]KAF5734237.1 Alpha/beta-Hydrolases superfamily protein [Tripterygium wilfordii]